MKENVDLLDLYKTDEKFKTYVDKYARAHGDLFPEDCFYHAIVIEYAKSRRDKK